MPVVIDQLIRSSRHTLGLQISPSAKLVVRAPLSMPESEIHRFILKKENWIRRHQQRLLDRLERRQEHTWPEGLNRQAWLNRYRYLAFTIIRSRCWDYADKFQLKVGEVKISNAKTRWGSCSPKGNLSFNWRLILAPLFVIDYLIAHELAHLTIKDHSSRFWASVARMCPGYEQAEQWLKRNGYLLDI